MIKSVFIKNRQCPGDICMLTCAVRDLKNTHPDIQINVDTSSRYLWDNNPYINPEITEHNADRVLNAEYPLIHSSCSHPFHFIHGFRLNIAEQLGISIYAGPHEVDIHLSDTEKAMIAVGLPERYWLINAGHKDDFTAKMWEFSRYAEVVDRLSGVVKFVQIGIREHTHKSIPGAIDMVGKTNGRMLIPIMYRAAGVLTGVSFPMHLSTMPVVDGITCGRRPCVCIVGAREPITWVQQPNMHALHVCGMLDCCPAGGCWRSRILPLNDGSDKDGSLCLHPVKGQSGQVIPRCMDMISVDEVVNKIMQIEEAYMCNCKKKNLTISTPTPSSSDYKATLVKTTADTPEKNNSTVSAVSDKIPARRPTETRAAYIKRISKSTNPTVTAAVSAVNNAELSAVTAAQEINLDQCYLCAKKHIGRAQIFFEEYYMGYDDRIKRLIDSLDVAEGKVREAFLIKEKIQAHLDMASGELLGKESEGAVTDADHVAVANFIREERLRLQDDAMYSPRFSEMLEKVQILLYSE